MMPIFGLASSIHDTVNRIAGMTVLSVVVLMVGALVDRLERYLLRWKLERSVSNKQLV